MQARANNNSPIHSHTPSAHACAKNPAHSPTRGRTTLDVIGQAAAEPVDNTALFVVIGVLAGTTIIAVIAAAAWLLGKAMATPPPATKGGKAANAV